MITMMLNLNWFVEESKGDTVKKLQECLGLDADGDFGRGTEAALKAWQVENGCTPDGIAGPQTLGKIFS